MVASAAAFFNFRIGPRSALRWQFPDEVLSSKEARFRFCLRDIAAVDFSIDVYIHAEIGLCHRLSGLRFYLTEVRRINRTGAEFCVGRLCQAPKIGRAKRARARARLWIL